MTATLDRPPLRTPVRRSGPERGPLAPGLLAAGWAAGAGLVSLGIPVLLTWAADSRSGSGAAAATRATGQLWLLAQGTTMGVPGGHVGLTPLALTLLPLALLHRAGQHAARTAQVRTLAAAGRLVLAVALPYAALAAVVAALSSTAQVRPAPWQALLGGAVVAGLGAGTGVLRAAALLPSLARLLPARARRLLRGTAVAAGLLLAAGSALAGASLALHLARASSLAAATDPGLVGGVALLVLGLLLVPNACVWGAAFLAGPGFAVGAATSVGPFGTTLGAVPALPLLAALPSGPLPTWLGASLLVLPVLAGATGGWALARRLRCGPGTAALEGLALGPCAGALMALLAWLSGGPLGGGRLTAVGPGWWQVGLAVTLETAVGAAAAAAVVRR